ncbi:hypothetical protein ACHAQH_004621 [Verticillium albo-atrum]
MVEGADLDLWLRDYAPTFVVKQETGGKRTLTGLDWKFKGCGGKQATPTTRSLPKTLLDRLMFDRTETSITVEGSSLEVDGEGTLLITESSILNDNRNPGKTREQLEAELKRTLGVEKVSWIPGRKNIDATDCHIDALARFARPGLVLVSKPNEVEETEWTTLHKEALKVLRSATDAKGRPFDVVEVMEPGPETFSAPNPKENRPVRSYLNFILVNRGVIMPQFGDQYLDAAAIDLIECIVHPVLLEELPRLGGGIHRSTVELPRIHFPQIL